MIDIKKILDKLDLNPVGRYENDFYIIDLENSDDYAKMYSTLDKNAQNTEFPQFESNTTGNTTKIVNYFSLIVENITYNIFLIADFINDKYYLKIGEAV